MSTQSDGDAHRRANADRDAYVRADRDARGDGNISPHRASALADGNRRAAYRNSAPTACDDKNYCECARWPERGVCDFGQIAARHNQRNFGQERG